MPVVRLESEGNMSKVTQNQMILEYLQTHESISQLEAMELFGIMRLGARIHNLRDEGYKIQTLPGKGKNRWGEKVHFAVYKLIGDEKS